MPPPTRLRRFRRGSALVTVLMVISISTLLSSALIGSAFFNLDFSMQAENNQVARNLAEGAIAVAAHSLLLSPSATPDATYSVPGPDSSSSGIVTFTQGATPWSLDNLTSSTSTSGYQNQAVPANAMHLIGVGVYKHSTIYSDALIWLPPYPYVLAASGKIVVQGSLVVGSVANSSDVSLTTLMMPANASLLPASMANNYDEPAAPGISMSPSSAPSSIYIAGDVQSAGSIVAPNSSSLVVNGAVLPASNPIVVPSINIAQYDTQSSPGVQTLPTAASTTTSLTGYGYCSPSAGGTAQLQDIKLNGGVLFVNGNLSAQSVSGNGAIITTGTVTITQSANLSSDDTLALVAGSDINLNGQGANSSAFKGLLYTQGNLTASNVTVVGSYVANGGSTSLGNVTLTNAGLLYAPDKATPNLPVETATASSSSTSTPTIVSLPPINVPVPNIGTYHSVTVPVSVTATYDGSNTTLTMVYTPSPAPGGPQTITQTISGTIPTATFAGFDANFNPIYTWSPSTPTALINGFSNVYQAFGWNSTVSNSWAAGEASNVLNNATTDQPASSPSPSASASSTGSSTPLPLPTPFTGGFNEFLSTADTARVLMWQPLLATPGN